MILKTDLLDISIQADYLSRDPPQETPEAARDRLVRTLSRPPAAGQPLGLFVRKPIHIERDDTQYEKTIIGKPADVVPDRRFVSHDGISDESGRRIRQQTI